MRRSPAEKGAIPPGFQEAKVSRRYLVWVSFWSANALASAFDPLRAVQVTVSSPFFCFASTLALTPQTLAATPIGR